MKAGTKILYKNKIVTQNIYSMCGKLFFLEIYFLLLR